MSKAPQPRKEATSVRLEPKIKYLVEIASRVQRRSVTNYIEWALEESLKSVSLTDNVSGFGGIVTLEYLKDELWDINEQKRFMILAALYSELLTFEEEKLFSILTKYKSIFEITLNQSSQIDINNIDYDRLDNHWELFNDAANDNASAFTALDNAECFRIETSSDKDAIKSKPKKTLQQKIDEFAKSLKTPTTPEEYEKYNQELQDFLKNLHR